MSENGVFMKIKWFPPDAYRPNFLNVVQNKVNVCACY